MPQAQDFSLVGLVLQADIVVKAVMLALAAASVVVWAIVLDKSLRLLAAGGTERTVQVRTDRVLPYGEMLAAMGAVSAAGFSRVALLAEPPR